MLRAPRGPTPPDGHARRISRPAVSRPGPERPRARSSRPRARVRLAALDDVDLLQAQREVVPELGLRRVEGDEVPRLHLILGVGRLGDQRRELSRAALERDEPDPDVCVVESVRVSPATSWIDLTVWAPFTTFAPVSSNVPDGSARSFQRLVERLAEHRDAVVEVPKVVRVGAQGSAYLSVDFFPRRRTHFFGCSCRRAGRRGFGVPTSDVSRGHSCRGSPGRLDEAPPARGSRKVFRPVDRMRLCMIALYTVSKSMTTSSASRGLRSFACPRNFRRSPSTTGAQLGLTEQAQIGDGDDYPTGIHCGV